MTDQHRTTIEDVLAAVAFQTFFVEQIAARVELTPAELEDDLGRLSVDGRVIASPRTVLTHATSLHMVGVSLVDRSASLPGIGDTSTQDQNARTRNEAHWIAFNREFFTHHRCC